MTSCPTWRSQSLLRQLADVITLGIPLRLLMVQRDGLTETFAAVLEKEEAIAGAILRLDVTIQRAVIYEPGEERQ